MSEYFCKRCGTKLSNGGPVGLFCPNRNCNYEMELARKSILIMKESNEMAEYKRLKLKYESDYVGDDD